ncbi:putative short-chain dehydrogenase/reductase family protein [Pseudomassariella vexata]|uniref:Putative short-chain dehydrogenase/reductase family protein n=1 Tax=Pseudomassariella vexata TaxID=1141098 RepID=A0A1Y2E8X2_9PEZI|nr:putative short-chain dehydrogenase/reductase family protein [Pseudomassariella vexata]ORY67736.1 putative short-chain dehydrogenase/reductase family protein [Pseudomassariella vexata]
MSSKLQSSAAWQAGFLSFLYNQLIVRPKALPPTTSLVGQTAIITGANRGLGFEAVRQLLELGLSHLVLAVRSQSKGDDAAAKLRTQFPNAKIETSSLDMCDYDSITAFARRCEELDRIDFVILNAAVIMREFERNPKTGHEMTFQIDYLSTALLTVLMGSVLKGKKNQSSRTGNPPVLSVAGSGIIYTSKLATTGPVLAQFDNPDKYSQLGDYGNSKLALMMFTSKLAAQISPQDVIINVFDPGFTRDTNIGNTKEDPRFAIRYLWPIVVKAFARQLRAGASIYAYALLGVGKESHGSFVGDWTIKAYPPVMYTKAGEALRDRLWEETMEELNFAGASSIVSRLRTN